MVRADTRGPGSASHVRELPERLASIRLGWRVVLGNDGLALHVAGRKIEQLITVSREIPRHLNHCSTETQAIE